MRDAFHGELARLGAELVEMCVLSGEAMRRATTALITMDLGLSERVLDGDVELDWRRVDCEERAQALLALQSPVAYELRLVLAAVYCGDKIERMGDLAAHVADIVRFNHPSRAVPAELDESFVLLGDLTVGMASSLSGAIAVPVAGALARFEASDRAVDDLYAGILARVTAPAWRGGHIAACNGALLARFYERFGDQAVAVAKHLEFAATGSSPP